MQKTLIAGDQSNLQVWLVFQSSFLTSPAKCQNCVFPSKFSYHSTWWMAEKKEDSVIRGKRAAPVSFILKVLLLTQNGREIKILLVVCFWKMMLYLALWANLEQTERYTLLACQQICPTSKDSAVSWILVLSG